MSARDNVRQLGRGDHPADLPAGQREDLARRADLDRPLGHPGKVASGVKLKPSSRICSHTSSLMTIRSWFARDCGHGFELVGVEQPAGRIVRIVEDDGARLWRNRRLDRLTIDPPRRRLQRDFDGRRPPARRIIGA